LSQIAWDGSQKLPVRILGTVRDAARAGRDTTRLAVPVAAWMRFVRNRAREGVAIIDPLADRLAEIGKSATGDGETDVPRFLGIETVFGRESLPAPYAQVLIAAYDALGRQGALPRG
jgi:fructuronate reductase